MVGKGVAAPRSDPEARFQLRIKRLTNLLNSHPGIETPGGREFGRDALEELLAAANEFESHAGDQLSLRGRTDIRSARWICSRDEFLLWRTEPAFCRPR
ncbi:MAG TPA: hypothetical protein VIN39_02660 [Candidatus Dormibacteraeota bacterium]